MVSLGYDRTFGLGNDGALKLGLFSRWSDKYLISTPSSLIRYELPAMTKSDANLTYTPAQGHWDLQLYVKNIEDKVYPTSLTGSGTASVSEPRTYGVKLGFNF